MQTIKKFLFLLSPDERKKAYFLLVMVFIMALLDMIGVASILPFMTVLTNPNLIETNSFLNTMFEISLAFGVANHKEFLFALGILVFIILVISLAFKALITYLQTRFILMREYSIGKRLVEGYLHQPYSWFLNRNSSDLGKNILSEVSHVIATSLKPLTDIIAKGLLTFALITLLIIADPRLALTAGLTLVISYALIFYFVRKYLNKIGKERLKNNETRFKVVSEAFGASKEVKVAGLEHIYTKLFSKSARSFALNQATALIINSLPRYILEAIAFGSILLLILYTMSQSGNFYEVLPIISLYVFTGYRLMPAVQQIYSSATIIVYAGPSLQKLYDDLKSLKTYNTKQSGSVLGLKESINLKNISYVYPNSSRTALKNINLHIPAKSTVGLVGATGSGKTTTVDIILGLLQAKKGILEVDGQIITNQNVKSWQKSIGYVPQFIYLSDDTVEANIAFGVEPEYRNKKSIEKAAKIANLHSFVTEELPKKYQTTIGERGVRLSGGQRQRIGIARALYHNPEVIILDEATSALDNETEQAVMDAVYNLHRDITIIKIAHRLNTVKNCDIIFKLDKGKLVDQGTFEEVLNIN